MEMGSIGWTVAALATWPDVRQLGADLSRRKLHIPPCYLCFRFFRTGPLDVSTFGTEHEHPCGAFLPISPLLLTPFFSGCGAGLCECVSDKISTITTLIPLVLVSPLLLIHREAAKEWMVSEQNKKPPVTDPVTWHSPNVSGLVEWFKSSAGVKWLMWSLERESFRWLFPQHS